MFGIGRPARRRLARVLRPAPAGPVGHRVPYRLVHAARQAIARRLSAHPGAVLVLAALGAGGLAGLAAGPVAAVPATAYTALGIGVGYRRRAARRADRAAAARVEEIGAVAAELRAGLAASTLTPEAFRALSGAAAAAWLISERLGAPLADLLDRVEADLRAERRLRASIAAQTAGTRATAWLLAGLPVAGVALGASMGVDPVRGTLRTPLGAGCVLGALGFQLAGLLWSARLTRSATGAVS